MPGSPALRENEPSVSDRRRSSTAPASSNYADAQRFRYAVPGRAELIA